MKWLRGVKQALGLSVVLSGAALAAESPLDFKVKDIDGEDVDLSQYSGKVVLIVNVASKCGFTKQYDGLQDLYEKYKDDGLVILGFPCNDFGGQEPGSEEQIKQFCTTRFAVTFPMFSKVSVKGDNASPLYQYLTSKEKGHDFGGRITWNFNKFLVGRDGKLVARFGSRDAPLDKKVVKAITEALSKEP